MLERFADPSGHRLRANVRDGLRDLLSLKRAAAEALRPKGESRLLIAAYNAENPEHPWKPDDAYLFFSTSDDGAAWPMHLRLLFAALLPRLAKRVPGLLEGLDSAEVERLRGKAQAAAAEHVESLADYQVNGLAAGDRAYRGEGRANFPHDMEPEDTVSKAVHRS